MHGKTEHTNTITRTLRQVHGVDAARFLANEASMLSEASEPDELMDVTVIVERRTG